MKSNILSVRLLAVWGMLSIFSVGVYAQTIQPIYLDANELSVQEVKQAATLEQQGLFEYYEYAMAQINQGADAADFFMIEKATDADDAVEPLLGNIQYGQDAPYNNRCPIINGRRAVTGCVATAMAQVMRYYSYPNVGKGNVTYTGGADGAKTINLADYPFDWDLILNSYASDYTEAQGNAVATLMLACGAALNMQYSADGSGINTRFVVGAMRDNFGFDSQIRFADSSTDPDPLGLIEYDWGETMREGFKKGYPVIFAGFPSSGRSGHCFVIDGYKVIDGIYYYHVNWGWTGASDGYYLITNLRPSDESYSGYGCTMVYNIFPTGWTDINDATADTANAKVSKVIRDGQVVIVKGDQEYTILGTKL